jgi:hypothetical protein
MRTVEVRTAGDANRLRIICQRFYAGQLTKVQPCFRVVLYRSLRGSKPTSYQAKEQTEIESIVGNDDQFPTRLHFQASAF